MGIGKFKPREDVDPHEMRESMEPVGIGGGFESTTAAWITPSTSDGEWVIGDPEIDVLYGVENRWLPLEDGSTISFHRREVLVRRDDRPDKAVYTNPHVCITRLPWSNGWFGHARLKPPSQKGAMDRSPLDPVVHPSPSRDAALKRLEALPYDPWAKGKWYVAGIVEPGPSLEDDARNTVEKTEYAFGLCPVDPRSFAESLREHRDVTRLRSQIEDGSLRFAYPKARIDDTIRLYPELRDDAEVFLYLALRQALGGPPDVDMLRIPEGRGDVPWLWLVDRIVRDRANRKNRKIARREAREGDA